MKKEQKYEEALRRIAFMSLKRKFLKDPPSIENYIEPYNFTATEVWEILEFVGEVAFDALKGDE